MSATTVIKAADAGTARAVLRLAQRLARPTIADEPATHPLAAELAIAQAALARSQHERKAAETKWQAEFDDALSREVRRIEADFVSDDAARVVALKAATGEAILTLQKFLFEPAQDVGIALAAHAIARLGIERSGDLRFVEAVISEELARVGQAMVTAVRVSAADATGVTIFDALRASLPANIAVEADPAIAPGTAEIRLKLGRIEIDPERAMSAMRDALVAEIMRS